MPEDPIGELVVPSRKRPISEIPPTIDPIGALNVESRRKPSETIAEAAFTTYLKPLAGRSLTEQYEQSVIGNLDRIIPQSVKKSHGLDYSVRLLAHLGKLAPGAVDFATSPVGAPLMLMHFIPATMPVAALADLGLAASQVPQALKAIRKARRNPTPEAVAESISGIVSTAGAAGAGIGTGVRFGRMARAGFRPEAAGVAPAPDTVPIAEPPVPWPPPPKPRARTVLEHLAGVSEAQKLRELSEGVVRERVATMYRDIGVLENQVRDEYIRMNGLPSERKWNFVDAIETAPRQQVRQRFAEDQPISDTLTEVLDYWRDQVRDLRIPGVLEAYYQNYFPHLFKDASKAQSWIAGWFAKRPLVGTQAWRRARKHPTMREAMAAVEEGGGSLEPITDNPVEITLLRAFDLMKFVTGHEIIREHRAKGLLREQPLTREVEFEYAGEPRKARFPVPRPPGWETIDDPAFRLGPRGIRGDLIAPAPVARIINNYLSQGLSANVARKLASPAAGELARRGLEGVREFNNLRNRIKVAMSFFHPVLESGVAYLNKLSLVPKYLAIGRPQKAAASFIRAFEIIPASDYIRGGKFMRQIFSETPSPEWEPFVHAYLRGGHRVRRDPVLKFEYEYRSNLIDKFFDKWEAGFKRVGLDVIPRALRYAGNWTMDTYVPRMKLANFARLAEFEMDRWQAGGRTPSIEEQRAAFGKISDAIDDRMGQLIQDNLFWDRSFRDLGHIGLQFFGWVYGSLRAGAGGVMDLTVRNLARIALGEKPELGHRAAWMMTLPFGYGLANAIYQYMMTGQSPTDMKDYLFPKNGRTRPDGTPERDMIAFTGYLKDYYEWVTQPKQTAGHKLSAAVAGLLDIFTNQDIMGREIRHPDDPAYKQISQVMRYIIEQSDPISMQVYETEAERPGVSKPVAAVRAAAGIRTAPAYVMRTPAQNQLLGYLRPQLPSGPVEAERFERRREARKLLEGIHAKSLETKDAVDAYRQGKISRNDLRTILQETRVDPWSRPGYWGRLFIRLTPEQAIGVWRTATTEERRKMLPLMRYQMQKAARELREEKRNRIVAAIRSELESFARRETSPPSER